MIALILIHAVALVVSLLLVWALFKKPRRQKLEQDPEVSRDNGFVAVYGHGGQSFVRLEDYDRLLRRYYELVEQRRVG